MKYTLEEPCEGDYKGLLRSREDKLGIDLPFLTQLGV